MVEDLRQRWDVDQAEDDRQLDRHPAQDQAVAQPSHVAPAGFLCAAGEDVAHLGGHNAGMEYGHSQQRHLLSRDRPTRR